MRSLAQRHDPSLLGIDLEVRKHRLADLAEDKQEENNPLVVLADLETIEEIVASPWETGQPVPYPPDE